MMISFHNGFILLLFASFPFISHSVNFKFPSFGPDLSLILLEGDAEIFAGEIQLTKVDLFRVGRVIYNSKIPLWDSSGNPTDFASRFSFRIDTRNASKYADGMAFFLAPVGYQIPPNSAGSYLGLFNTSTTSDNMHVMSVEFDTFHGHVGININSLTSAVTTPWNASLHSRELATAWIVYNASGRNLRAFWSYGSGPNSSVSYNVDLKEFLPQWVIIGISAATGSYNQRITLESWEFTSDLDMKEGGRSNQKKLGLAVGLGLFGCFLIISGVVAFLVLRKRKNGVNKGENQETTNLKSMNNDLEQGAGPQRFSYEDLASATNNFSVKKRLGQGGFGEVYKGYLIDKDIPIAVKKFSRGSKQGKKQYLTEVKIISMLRHRNLVQLIGWCHDRGEFLLIYEFMPNGSLDYHLFGERNPLNWDLRYKITQGLASALLYLHEEWEQCVVHRDIKSSNVMLDSNFNVKLGDFGLARLMDHELGPQTTGVAGTLGYLAPEYVTKGRVSKESDVYSFGVVALEIATGRKSVDPLDKESSKGLVDWVWDLYGNRELMSGLDEKVEADFVMEQAERLMVVGLWCAHPDWSLRPSIQVVSHVLNFEVELPKLPAQMPVAMYYVPNDPSISSGEAMLTNSIINVGR